ncbi:HSP70 family protein [Apiospora phragmitis]|uniref:HSP70 family protein n=1 Tax=Apiospora phragmitis TaxID=2905665 RepID=A0ABR1VQG6_9PEZI
MEWSPFADRPASNAGSFYSRGRPSFDAASVGSLRFSDVDSPSSNKRPAPDAAAEPTPPKRRSQSIARSATPSIVSNASSGLFVTPKPSPLRAPFIPIAGPSRPPPPPSIPEISDFPRSPFSAAESSVSRLAPSLLDSSFAITPPVQVISDYPGTFLSRKDPVLHQVPTELSYALGGGPVKLTRQALARLAEDQDPFGDDVSESSFESLDFLPNRNEVYRWGYRVHQTWLEVSTIQFRKFKLLLQDNIETAGIRKKLHEDLDTLAARGRRKRPIDLIIDYLTPFIAHVKKMLEEEGILAGTDKEIVMCIPTVWSQRACQKMHYALAKASKSVGFEGVQVEHDSIKDLFIVSEPEAAAEVVLREELNIRTGQRLVFVDVGAGTVDLINYLVSWTVPRRLKEEGAPPSGEITHFNQNVSWSYSIDRNPYRTGGMCGSSFLNEKFQTYILGRLKKHKVASKKNDRFLRRKAEEITYTQFEFFLKRSLDIYEDDPPTFLGIGAFIGLSPDKEQMFGNNNMRIPFSDIQRIFLEYFHEIWALVVGQLESCKSRGNRADVSNFHILMLEPKLKSLTGLLYRVVLIGGFSDSPSLREFLKRALEKYDGGGIQLIAPKMDFATTVSSEAILRAFNKEHGPQRFARSSYDILRHLPKDVYNSKHEKRGPNDANARAQRAPCTGEPYVRDTIEWFIKKDDFIPEDWTRKPIRCQHFVDRCEDPGLVVWEKLYVSEYATESLYKKIHLSNKGCEMVGYIRVDMSFLKHEGLLVPKRVPEGCQGDDYYEVEFDLVMKVQDRDLKCFVKYGKRILQECQINIASAFPAGVQ